jgi:hypothetical protein
MASFSNFNEILQSSSVDIVKFSNFKSKNNLVLARSNLLQIYSLSCFNDDNLKNPETKDLSNCRLLLEQEFTLCGIIQSIEVVKTKDRDFLLVGFNDAKLSLIQYCNILLISGTFDSYKGQETLSLQTISIHTYEREEYKVAMFNLGTRN